jgi:outer membrane protein assembly factor BamB
LKLLSPVKVALPPLAGALVLACAARLAAPPALFPLKPAWRTSVEEVIEGPLATDGRAVFLSMRKESVVALDAGDGHVAWRATPGAVFLAASPGILVARTEDGTLLGLDPAKGSVLWKEATSVVGRLPPVIDGGTVFVAGEGLAAVDAATGRLLWTASDGGRVSAPPTAAGGHVFVGEADGMLRCRDRVTGASLWAVSTRSILLAPALVDERRGVFVGTTARAFLSVTSDGGKSRWRWKLGADVLNPPILFGRSVLFASHEAVLYALNADNGHLDWRAPLPARPLSGPLLNGTAVLVACLENDVVGFDARTGRALGGFKTDAEILAAPLLVGGRLHVAFRDRSVGTFWLNQTPAKPAPSAPPKPQGRRPAVP